MLINVLSYNMSWATQVNKVLGTEADFVDACQHKYKEGGFTCIEKAIKNIGKLESLDLVGLQEVNSHIEEKIMKVQPKLTKFKRSKVEREVSSILWNPLIFGKLIEDETINLIDGDDRPCLILVLQKEEQIFVIINLHAPGPFDEKKSIVQNILNKHITKNSVIREHIFNKDAKIIILGDFNDNKTSVNVNSPLLITNTKTKKQIKLRYNKSKKQSKKTLTSCCWHKPGHKYGYLKDTGDYILVNENIKQHSIMIPPIFRKAGRPNRLFSDHMPVFSVLEI